MLNRALTIVVILFFLVYGFLVMPPHVFPVGKNIYVKEGGSLRSVSKLLQNEGVIRSRTLFETFVILYGGEKKIQPGDYVFGKAVPVFEVARVVAGGGGNLVSVKVTIPEGFKVSEIAELFSGKLKNFNNDQFILKASNEEGYLFPDTYFFLNTDNEDAVITYMKENFTDKVGPLLDELKQNGKSDKEIAEIIVMASIIEKEAKGEGDRELISGILWNRIKIGMPLQADAAPDTYNAKGLPLKPIANPGLLSIKAAINPKISNYLYYLHDKNGVIHFAKNFDEHRQNIQKYLK